MRTDNRRNLLVVDDEKDVLETMEMYLSGEGLNVMTALDGGEALDFIASHPVDLVITDIRMPHIDGIQLLKTIKKWDETIQVIVMTGYTDVKDASESMAKYDAAGFWPSPLKTPTNYSMWFTTHYIKETKLWGRQKPLSNALIDIDTHQKARLNEKLRI